MQVLWTCPRLRASGCARTHSGCGWRGTHGTRWPGAPSRQAAGPAPFYMLGEMGIPVLLIKKKNPKLFICLFLPVLGLHCYTWALFSCGKQGLFFVAVCRASHCSGFSCHGAWAFEHRLSSCWVWAQLPHGMWDLPGLGMEPVFPHTHRRTQPLDHQGSPSSHFLNLKGMFFLEGYDMSVGWCSGRTFMRRWRQERPQAGV